MIQIDTLHIKSADLTPQEARELGQYVANYLTDNLHNLDSEGQLGDIKLKLTVPSEMGHSTMAEKIGSQILNGISAMQSNNINDNDA